MKKLLILQGSPHLGGVCDLVLQLLLTDSVKSNFQINLKALRDLTIKPCLGCLNCKSDLCCSQDTPEDSGQEILKNCLCSDLVLFVAPIYFYSLPAISKALIDRANFFYQHQELVELKYLKPTLIVLTAGRKPSPQQFSGALLTLKYFCLTLGREISAALTLPGLETKFDLIQNESLATKLKSFLNAYI